MNSIKFLKSLRTRPVYWGIILTVIIEMITVFFRFVLRMESTADTAWIAKFTFGLRIHHGYIGIFIIFLHILFKRRNGPIKTAYPLGIGLVLSDIIHHFIVLWLVYKSPQFDLFYPPA